MALFRRTRFVVSTILVGLPGELRAQVLPNLAAARRRIMQSEDFAVASAEIARVAGLVLELESSISHVANFGEVFRSEEQASRYGDDTFAELASRYLSTGEHGSEPDPEALGHAAPGRTAEEGDHLIVAITIAYEGEERDLEKTLATRSDLSAALSRVIALHHRGALLLAHVHHVPAAPGDVLTDDRLMMSWPELLEM